MKRTIMIALLAATLGACASVPTTLQGQYAKSTPRDALATHSSAPVRWGGQIIRVEPKADSTCFEIISRPLDSQARPDRRKDSDGGRFIACHAGFYDPEVYARGRDLTVVGRYDGSEQGKVGQFDYTYPRIAATSIYLWPKREPRPVPYYDPWLAGPGWNGYLGWGWGWGPYWGPSTIIIREHGHRPSTPPPVPKR